MHLPLPTAAGDAAATVRLLGLACLLSLPLIPAQAALHTDAPADAPAPVLRPLQNLPPPRALETAAARPDAKQWAAGADVIVVSGYEPSAAITQVQVAHDARPVLLVLSSYESTRWQVLPAPGTRIRAIVVAAYKNSEQLDVQAPPEVPVVLDRLPHAYEAGNIRFRELLGKLHANYGAERVLALRGAYRLPARVDVHGPFAPDPLLTLAGVRPEAPALRFAFDLVSVDGRRLPFTNTGPKDGQGYSGIVRGGMLRGGAGAAAVREDGREAFYFEGNGSTLVWAPEGMGGRREPLLVPPGLPRLSWGSGLAWDTRKGVLAIATFGGEGYLYRYDTHARIWLDARSLQNRDLIGLSVNAETGEFLGISSNAELVRFNGQGELQAVQPLRSLLRDLDSTYDRNNGRLDGLTVAANGKAIAVVNVSKGTVTHIWTLDAHARKAQLTYKLAE